MKSDVIVLSNDGSHMDQALLQADKTAAYKELSEKDTLHIRLLTEEMLNMMRSITGTASGIFWIEDEDENGAFRLHLKMETFVDFDKREKLLAVSTDGRNAAARGFMGKVRTFFDPLDSLPVSFNISPDSMNTNLIWSMRGYQQVLKAQLEQEQPGAKENWDELEKSVVSHIADDVKVSIRGRIVEMIIDKTCILS